MSIQYAKREYGPDSLEEISWVAAWSFTGIGLTYDGRNQFVGTKHVQSVIKFGIDLIPAKREEVPESVRAHAEANISLTNDNDEN